MGFSRLFLTGGGVVRFALQQQQMGNIVTQRFQPAMIIFDPLIDLGDKAGNVAALQCEAAALLAAGTEKSNLIIEKHRHRGPDGRNATVSIARIPE